MAVIWELPTTISKKHVKTNLSPAWAAGEYCLE
jgi:hypothetical protein